MAEDGSLKIQTDDAEPVVNRWIVDYYIFRALHSLEKNEYKDFCSIKLFLDKLLLRPVESNDGTPTKIQALQFLSRVNECEKLDVFFEQVPPLESALSVLEDMRHECNIPQQDFKKVSTSIKEMIVAISIKSGEFDKAKEMLQKHFPKPMVGKKAIFMGLVKQKCRNHEVIEQINFQQFKEEMLAFCQKICCFGIPFLHKAAKQLVDRRSAEQDDGAAAPDEHTRLSPSCSQQPSTAQLTAGRCSVIQRVRLEAAYNALAVGAGQKTFAQLENEVEVEMEDQDGRFCLRLSPEPQRRTEADSEWDGLFQRDSGSPMEASPADQTEQTDVAPETQAGTKTPAVLRSRKHYSVAQLVIEPDSQPSSQAPAAVQQRETEVRSEDATPPLTTSGRNTPQRTQQDSEATVTPPNNRQSKSRKRKGGSNRASTRRSKSADSKENSLESEDSREAQSRASGSLTGLEEKSSADGENEKQEVEAPCKKSQKKRHKQRRTPPSKGANTTDDSHTPDSSLDDSPSFVQPSGPIPRNSSTPHKGSAQNQGPSHSKWKILCKNAKESKETWSDEETYFTFKKDKRQNESSLSNSGGKRKKWTETETQKLKEGVKKFGEGNWSKIKCYYSFHDRSNVNLKDRWRTLQNQKDGVS